MVDGGGLINIIRRNRSGLRQFIFNSTTFSPPLSLCATSVSSAYALCIYNLVSLTESSNFGFQKIKYERAYRFPVQPTRPKSVQYNRVLNQ
jgi:hypothetical protein